MTVRELADRMQAVDLFRLMEEAVKANEEPLVDMQRGQLEIGKRADNDPIIPFYRSPGYAVFKQRLGSKAPTGIPDLKLTGAFHRGILMDVNDRDYAFYSTDEKAQDLTSRYPKIWGLTDENKEKAKEINTRKLAVIYKQAVGLK